MKSLSNEQLSILLTNAKTIEADGHGLKVARLENGDFLKLFRRKRLLSSSLWSLPARRFARNAKRLQTLGIAAPVIQELILVPSRHLNGVRYEPLPGETLRNRWRELTNEQCASEVRDFGIFLGKLHEEGVYFRSLHLGNVLRLPDGRLGLIDLSDMKIGKRPLTPWMRRRNLQHILRYPEDIAWLAERHRQDWLSGYAHQCGQTTAQQLERAVAALHRGI